VDQTSFDRTSSRRRGRRRALVALLMATSLATVGAGAMSLAVFTDSKASTGSWTSGTVILGVAPATTFTATGIMPGDTGSQTVTVSDSGTGALRYAMTSASTNTDGKGLAAQMTLTIKTGTCVSPVTTLYSGGLSAALLGDPTQGAQAGDRTVAAGASDTLCFAWTFPLASGNPFQGAATSTTFTFAAEQTANN
jgi:Camelysin metallo-endopeptidase